MRFYTFFSLLIISFLFVCLPLLAALFSSVNILDGLVQQSVAAVYNSVDRVNRSREIAELLQSQERMARQFIVLGEPAQLKEVNKVHHDIENALEYLLLSEGNEPLNLLIEELRSKTDYIIAVLNRFTSDPEILIKEKQKVLSKYQEVGKLALTLLEHSNTMMLEEVQGLRVNVAADKGKLAWQTSGLIFFAVLFSAIFIFLIFRPVRQIDKGIESLGEGNFDTPISVSGPRDLENVGTKLDWLRERLATLDREKIKLIAHISHDLKTPLSSIKEGTSLLRDELVGPINDRQKDVVDILEKNCVKLQRLIEDILNFNMAQAKQLPLQKDLVQLNTIIEEVIEDHHHSMLARNIKLSSRILPVEVYGNKKQLKAVFDNLISNAVKFTPDNGTIRIMLKSDEKIAACLVEDNGVGIDEEERSQVFSPFYRGKKGGKSVIKGSGLGLAMSREYVQLHGGSIRALPSKKGARFAVTLPLTEQTKS